MGPSVTVAAVDESLTPVVDTFSLLNSVDQYDVLASDIYLG
jgi:hypothetical protein